MTLLLYQRQLLQTSAIYAGARDRFEAELIAHNELESLTPRPSKTNPGIEVTIPRGQCANVPGDFNHDGWVNGTDLKILEQFLGTADPFVDINQDGVVNDKDVELWAWNVGKAPSCIVPVDKVPYRYCEPINSWFSQSSNDLIQVPWFSSGARLPHHTSAKISIVDLATMQIRNEHCGMQTNAVTLKKNEGFLASIEVRWGSRMQNVTEESVVWIPYDFETAP